MSLIRGYLKEHPYIDMNRDLSEKRDISWIIVESFDKTFTDKLSPLHQNQLLVDCLM